MPERVAPNRRARRTRSPLVGLAGLTAWMLWRSLRRSRQRELAVSASVDERERERPMTAYEPSDWDIGPIALVYAGVVALLVISSIVLIVAYPRALPDANRDLHIAPPGPRLQTNSEADLQTFREGESKRLDSYYWIDKQKGVVHIPIEQAMKKLVDTGIPGFPKEPK